MTRYLLNIFLALSPFALFSCKGSRPVTAEKPHLPNRKTKELLDSLDRHELRCDWLSIKYDVEIKTPKLEDSFKLYVRLKQDSVIWVSATYYAVEIARFLFTPDSVKYMDRKNNRYYIGDYSYITDQFMIDANFDILQSLVLANSSALVSMDDEKVRSAKDNGRYFISFLRKGQLRRAIRKDDLRKPIELVVSLWIDPNNFRLSKTTLDDFEDDRKLIAEYSNFQPACNSYYPGQLNFTVIAANEQSEVKTSVIKLTTDKKVSLSFTIPEKYESLVP